MRLRTIIILKPPLFLFTELSEMEKSTSLICVTRLKKIDSTLVVSPSFKRSDDQREEDEFFGEEGGIKNGNTAISLKMMIIRVL